MEPSPTLPLWTVRAVAAAAVLCLLLLVGWQARTWKTKGSAAPADSDAPAEVAPPVAPPPPPPAGDQKVSLKAMREAKVRVTADGKLKVERTLVPGEVVEVTADERIEVELPAVEAVRVTYNDQDVIPQGRQDEPRRLVFIDDRGR